MNGKNDPLVRYNRSSYTELDEDEAAQPVRQSVIPLILLALMTLIALAIVYYLLF